MTKYFSTTVILLLVALSVHSQTKQESIRTLINLMQPDSLIDKIVRNTFPVRNMRMSPQSSDTSLSSKYKEDTTRREILKATTKKFIQDDMVALYDKYYTEKEIKDFIAFYQSPSGQKMIKRSLDIQRDVREIVMRKYLPVLFEPLSKERKDSLSMLSRSNKISDAYYPNFDKVFTKVEQPASFQGGAEGWRRYLENHMNRAVAKIDGAPVGNYTVRVQFIVDTQGNVSQVKVIDVPAQCPSCGPEAVKMIQSGPKWNPAVQNGRTVNYQVVQCITFQVIQ